MTCASARKYLAPASINAHVLFEDNRLSTEGEEFSPAFIVLLSKEIGACAGATAPLEGCASPIETNAKTKRKADKNDFILAILSFPVIIACCSLNKSICTRCRVPLLTRPMAVMMLILNRRAPEQKYFLPKRKKIGQEQLDDIPLHDETRFKCFPTKAYTVQNFIKFTQSMLLTT